MANEKTINYPSQEWLDAWVDKYLDEHPDEKIEDFGPINEQAEAAWWDNEIEHNRPTPFDLTPEEQKASKAARMGAKNEHKFVKRKEPVKRERKPNDTKRALISYLQSVIPGAVNEDGEALKVSDVAVSNIEREVTFKVGEKSYSITLIEHRAPKADKATKEG